MQSSDLIAIIFVCLALLLLGCGDTTAAPVDVERFTWDAGDVPQIVTDAGDIYVLSVLVGTIAYSDNYDISRYLSPAETIARGSGDCTAYARLWMAGLDAQGDTVRMLEIWYPGGAHAVCLFHDKHINPDDIGWRITSNEVVYLQNFGTDEHQAAQAAADFLRPGWWLIRERDNSGTLLWSTKRPR